MIDLSTLLLFLLAAFTLFLSPGPNMAFVLSHGVSHGMRGGFAAALGIAVADVVLSIGTATGITALVAAWPPSFDLLRYLGAGYLLWLAARALLSSGQAVVTRQGQTSMARVFRMAMLNCLLNPKALLFFMVFLPQFVVASHGDVALQLLVLGCTLSFVGLLFHSVLAMFSGRIGEFLKRNPRQARYQGWLLGSVLAGLALRLLLLERPTAR